MNLAEALEHLKEGALFIWHRVSHSGQLWTSRVDLSGGIFPGGGSKEKNEHLELERSAGCSGKNGK
jgi:hypothetical protein